MRTTIRFSPAVMLLPVLAAVVWSAMCFLQPVGGAAEEAEPPIKAGPEFLPAPASKNHRRLPAVAYGGGVFLIVQQEGWNGVGGDSDIRGTLLRLPAAGKEQDKPSAPGKTITICAARDHQEAPQVAFSGGVFLVVWHDLRNGTDADVYAARVTPTGKVLDPHGIPVAVRPHNQNFPLVVGNGKNFLVLWREVRYGQTYDLMGTIVDAASGKVRNPQGILLAKDATLPAAAFSGRHYFIGWLNAGRRHKLRFCRYDPQTLAREENEPTAVGHPDAFGHMGQLKLLSGGGETAAVWARGLRPDPWGWGGPGAILSVRLKDDGSVPENKAFNKIRWSPRGREQYVKRLLPGVLDTAHWRGYSGWPQGKPGGFKEATDGLWPHAYLAGAAIPGSKGGYFVVWVRAHMRGLAQTGRFDILGGRLKSGAKWEAPDYPPVELCADGGANLLPALSASEPGRPFLLLYERRAANGRSTVRARFVKVASP